MRKGFGSEVERNSGQPISMNAGGVPKLRLRAALGLGEHQAEQLAVQRMMRMTSETAEPPRHVVVIEDVTRGLGLDVAEERRIQNVVKDTNVEFTSKTQTQRITLAKSKLIEILRASPADGDVRMEITKRAMAWWRKSVDTELVRSRTVHFIRFPTSVKKSEGPRLLLKGARGGKYFKRVPTGNSKKPYRYYYTKEQYERAHGDDAHIHGPDVKRLAAQPQQPYIPGLIRVEKQTEAKKQAVREYAAENKKHLAAAKKLKGNTHASNLLQSIRQGKRVFYYSDSPPGWTLLTKLGIAARPASSEQQRGERDMARLTDFGRELDKFVKSQSEHYIPLSLVR